MNLFQGDLKQFLMSLNTESSRVIQSTLSLAQQLEMVYQVARGMEHLSLNHLVHGDLAARNVLVTPSLDLKITSLSLSRDIHASDYFLFHDRLIPLRWMPAESVFNNEFSTSSDIWSFGVFVLEVFRFGALPLPGKANDEILIGLKAGAKLHCSTPLPQYGCPEGLWKLVQRCTSFYPIDRPSFTEIVNALGNLVADSGV